MTTRRCVDCQNFQNAEHIAKGSARQGWGKCKATVMAPATFITAAYSRECDRFEAAPADVVAKRIAFLDSPTKAERAA